MCVLGGGRVHGTPLKNSKQGSGVKALCLRLLWLIPHQQSFQMHLLGPTPSASFLVHRLCVILLLQLQLWGTTKPSHAGLLSAAPVSYTPSAFGLCVCCSLRLACPSPTEGTHLDP